MAEASAPASSANLGPGFDCLAVALDIRCRVTAEPCDQWDVHHFGSERPRPGDRDAVLMAAQAVTTGSRPLSLTVDNAIPLARGLGSSAAACAAGAAAAIRAGGREPSPDEIYEFVSEAEGHPDNAAATVYGGLQLVGAGGEADRIHWSERFDILVLVPDHPLPTREARAVVPSSFDRDVLVRTAARLAALTTGIALGSAELVRMAAGDEVHESARNMLRPEISGWMARAREAGALHAAWSGAGPSVVVIVPASDTEAIGRRLSAAIGGEATIVRPGLAAAGIE